MGNEVHFPLNAREFLWNKQFYDEEFKYILNICYCAYKRLLADGIKIVDNENKIRDVIFSRYLGNQNFLDSMGCENYLFDKEVPEGDGRIDIRVMPVGKGFRGRDAYYIIECKRLNNIQPESVYGLNAKYVANGIYRFESNYYSCRLSCNGMFGFVVSKMNIKKNVKSINSLLGRAITNDKGDSVVVSSSGVLCHLRNVIPGFPHVYRSKHVTFDRSKIVLYHLMLDVSKIVQVNAS